MGGESAAGEVAAQEGALARELRALGEVFRSPDLRRLQLAWLGTSVGVWGSALVLAVYAFREGGAAAVGVMALVRTLPGGPVAPLLTSLADRVSRRSVLLVSNLARAAILAGVAVLVAADAALPAIYVLVALFAVASPGYKPAQSALLPALARTPSELSSANAAVTMLTNAGFLVGSLAGGVLLTVLSVEVVLGALAGAFAVSLLPLLRIARDAPPEADPDAQPMRELVEGFETVRRDPELLLLVALGALAMLALGAVDVLVVVSALGFLDVGESGAGYLSAAMGVGAVVGGFAVLGLLGSGRLTVALVVGALLVGVPAILIGLLGGLVVVAIGLAVIGAGDAYTDTGLGTLLQRLTPDHVLSRVFGVVEALAVLAMALGSVATGLLVESIGARGTFIVVGTLMPLGVLLARTRLAAYEAGAPVPGREYGLLRAHSIFAPLPIATAERLARGLEEVRPQDGAFVIRQGDPGDRFYLIAEGSLEVFVDGAHVRTMGPGDGFGEIALLRDEPRTATVQAGPGVVLLALDRDRFLTGVTGLGHSARAANAVATERLTTVATVEAWLAAIAGAQEDPVQAVELAEAGLAAHPGEPALQQQVVLALARAGATGEAARRFERYGLDDAALGARIAGDLALEADAEHRPDLAQRALDLSLALHARAPTSRTAVDAAAMSLLAGDAERARELAGLAAGGEDPACAAEARVLLGDEADGAQLSLDARRRLRRLDGVSLPADLDVAVTDADPVPAPSIPIHLHGEVSGYEHLTEPQVDRFANGLIDAIGTALEPFEVLEQCTSGDRLSVVFTDPVAAARCALALRDAMTRLRASGDEVWDALALRLVAGTGAGVEPVTPPGEVYATPDFAALLAARRAEICCEEVGSVYRLSRRWWPTPRPRPTRPSTTPAVPPRS